MLPHIIAENHVVFIGGRQILDDILAAKESVGDWKARRRKGFLLKLEYEKAYYKVDWLILDAVMEKKVLESSGDLGLMAVYPWQTSRLSLTVG